MQEIHQSRICRKCNTKETEEALFASTYNICDTCQREYDREYYQKNKVRLAAKRKNEAYRKKERERKRIWRSKRRLRS